MASNNLLKHKGVARLEPPEAAFEIRWPDVARIKRVFQLTLTLHWSTVQRLELDAAQTMHVTELAPIVVDRPDLTEIDCIAISPRQFCQDELRHRLIITLNMVRVV